MPFEKIIFTTEYPLTQPSILTELKKGEILTELSVCLNINGKSLERKYSVNNNTPDYLGECELRLALMLYDCFVEVTGYTPDWGILTGVRPAKLYSRLVKANGEERANDYFKNTLLVKNEKIRLCASTYKSEEQITCFSRPESFSLYVSIPFCPTRCAYCSFVSHSTAKSAKLIKEYLPLLFKELELTAKIAKQNNLRLETVYIGGGTPTTLSANELKDLILCIKQNFDLSFLREFTVEAGRPDTVTREKLEVLRDMGVDRISINPQTVNDDILKSIGRAHTAEQFFEAFKMAKEIGFKSINTDLIAGLHNESFESFKNTVDKIIELSPENVTVHTLSLKRASNYSTSGLFPEKQQGEVASKMVNYALSKLEENEIYPYYMYRQSKTVGNLENVGYARKGHEGLYNVYIMDETHTVLACGASAVTKLKEPNGPFIERIFNFKYPYEYISRFCSIIERKEGISKFYDKYNRRN